MSKGGARGQDPLDLDDKEWELTVGIEIHAQLNTAQKLFSPASTSTSSPPNTNISPHDLAYPGAQPIFQLPTLIPAIRAALALNCTVHHKSSFDRKHYFYPDQPAGYQITQYYEPFASDGFITLSLADGIDPRDAAVTGSHGALRVHIRQVQVCPGL